MLAVEAWWVVPIVRSGNMRETHGLVIVREALQNAITVVPGAFEMNVRNRVPWMRPQDHAHTVEGLRKAGWQG